MSLQPHEPDLKKIWQNQETEEAIMSVEEVRLNARKYLRRKKRDLIARSAFVVLAAASIGIFLSNSRFTSLRFVAGIVMATLLISRSRTTSRPRKKTPLTSAMPSAT